MAIVGALVAGGAPSPLHLGVAAAVLVVAAIAPERRRVPLNSQDRLFLAQEHGLVAMNSLHVVDARAPFDRDAVVRAVDRLARETEMLRTFVRETWWTCERFASRAPWVAADDVVAWLDDARAVEDFLAAPLDLARTPPFRVVSGPRPDGEGHRLVLLVHHSAVDGDAGLRLFARLLARYDEARSGRPFADAPPTPPGPRLRSVLLRRGPLWTWRMIRAHFHPLRRSGVVNASMIDDPTDRPSRVRARLTELSAETFEALKARADALGVTRNDLLVAASMRAVDAHLRAKAAPSRDLSLLLPSSLRADLDVVDCLNNYVGAVPVKIAPDVVRADDLPARLSRVIKEGRALDVAVGAAVNVGMVGVIFPFGLFRSGLRKLDLDVRSSYFTYLISSPRIPRDIDLPSDVERVAIHGPLTRRPAFGFVLTVFRGRVVVAYEYLSPCVSEATVDAVDALFKSEVDRLLRP